MYDFHLLSVEWFDCNFVIIHVVTREDVVNDGIKVNDSGGVIDISIIYSTYIHIHIGYIKC